MFGQAPSQTSGLRPDCPSAPIQQISILNDETGKILYDTLNGLGSLLTKVRGSQPSQGCEPSDKVIERHLLGDAYSLRDLSQAISVRVQELHSVIGLDR